LARTGTSAKEHASLKIPALLELDVSCSPYGYS